MLCNGGDHTWVTSDTELRCSQGRFNIALRSVSDLDIEMEVHQAIFKYRTGLDAIMVRPFSINGAWGVDRVHNHTIFALLLAPERKTGMKIVSGVEMTILGGMRQEHCIQVGGFEIVFIEASPSPDTIIIRHPKLSSERLVFDAYSGFGGWFKGGQIVGAPYKLFWEIDPEVAELCSRNTGTHILRTSEILQMSHETFKYHLAMGITVLGDFGEKAVWEFLCQAGIWWASFSLPCPSWSRLSTERGLDDMRGGQHHLLIDFVKCAQPLLLVLENVDALLSHRHWIDIRAKFVELGFQLIHVGADSLQRVMPMSRNRACIILANQAYASEFRTFGLGNTDFPPLDYMMNPRSCGYIHEDIPKDLLQILTIEPADRDMLVDKKFWPFDWGFVGTHKDKIQMKSRVHSKSQILPCAVAKYASPRDISKSLLESKGLFMRIMQQTEPEGEGWFFRWISPFEQLATMGFPVGTILPKQKALAYHVVGNSIAVAHSIISLLRVRALLPQTFLASSKSDLFEALVEMRAQVGKLANTQLCSDDEYMWLQPVVCVRDELSSHVATQIDTPFTIGENSPDTQAEVDAIAKLIKTETNFSQTPEEKKLLTRTKIPVVPYLFVPDESNMESRHEIVYHQKFVAFCVPQLAFSTTERSVKSVHDLNPQNNEGYENPMTRVSIRTLDGTWIWEGTTCTPWISVSVLVRTALPHASPDLFDFFILGGQQCSWESLIDTRDTSMIQLAFKARFVGRHVQVNPSGPFHTVLCDACDTPMTISEALLENYEVVQQHILVNVGNCIVGSESYILAQPNENITIRINDCETDCKVGVIHPITGKFHEVIMNKNCTVRDLQKMIAPHLCESISVIAEINHKRISIETPLNMIDSTHVVRLRCFPMNGGAKGDIRGQLREQLLTHGVPENVVQSRIHVITSAIPEPRLVECFAQGDVWSALKNICTSSNVRLVQPQELKERQIHMRQEHRGNDYKSNAKGKGKGKSRLSEESSKHAPLLPPLVENVEFHQDFRGPDGTNIPIIFPSSMCTGSTGVCPMNLAQAKSFLPVSIISPDPLAILILGHHESLSENKITVAGTLKTTNMPCLLPATLIQFGATQVEYQFSGLKVEVSPIESRILEIVINKDRCLHWEANMAPIDIVAKNIPAIKEKTILIGTWGWKSLDANWKPTHASTAKVWRGNVRIASTAVTQMLKASGPGGISLWPKDNEYKADQDYVHITVNADNETPSPSMCPEGPTALRFRESPWPLPPSMPSHSLQCS